MRGLKILPGRFKSLYLSLLLRCCFTAASFPTHLARIPTNITRTFFKDNPLVYLVQTHYQNAGVWIDIKKCCWDAPDCLRSVTALRPCYPDLKPLFQGILGLQNASVETIVAEIVQLDGNVDAVGDIKNMLLALGSQILQPADTTKMQSALRQLEKHRVIPIKGKEGQSILVTLTDQRWFVADRKSYQKAFGGKVHLLDFSLRDQQKLEPLLSRFSISLRRISELVVEETVIKGKDKAVVDAAHTNKYRGKVHHLLA